MTCVVPWCGQRGGLLGARRHVRLVDDVVGAGGRGRHSAPAEQESDSRTGDQAEATEHGRPFRARCRYRSTSHRPCGGARQKDHSIVLTPSGRQGDHDLAAGTETRRSGLCRLPQQRRSAPPTALSSIAWTYATPRMADSLKLYEQFGRNRCIWVWIFGICSRRLHSDLGPRWLRVGVRGGTRCRFGSSPAPARSSCFGHPQGPRRGGSFVYVASVTWAQQLF